MKNKRRERSNEGRLPVLFSGFFGGRADQLALTDVWWFRNRIWRCRV